MAERVRLELSDWIISLPELELFTGGEFLLVAIPDPDDEAAVVPRKLQTGLLASPGGAVTPFVYTSVIPLYEYVVNHNLGRRPLVQILTAGGIEVDAEIRHLTFNQVRVYFASPFIGSVICI